MYLEYWTCESFQLHYQIAEGSQKLPLSGLQVACCFVLPFFSFHNQVHRMTVSTSSEGNSRFSNLPCLPMPKVKRKFVAFG